MMAKDRRIAQIVFTLALALALAFAPVAVADSRAERINAWIGDATLTKTMLHPDGTVEKTYKTADGGFVQVVYRPDGRIDLFGDPASIDYEPPVAEEVEAPPFGVWLEESKPLSAAAEDVYSKLELLVPPKYDLGLKVTSGVSIPAGAFDETMLANILTLEPVRRLVVTPSTLALTRWRVRWIPCDLGSSMGR